MASAEQLDTYLYIILDLKIFYFTILCIYFKTTFIVLCYKVFLRETF